jgi:hypothetical protein
MHCLIFLPLAYSVASQLQNKLYYLLFHPYTIHIIIIDEISIFILTNGYRTHRELHFTTGRSIDSYISH